MPPKTKAMNPAERERKRWERMRSDPVLNAQLQKPAAQSHTQTKKTEMLKLMMNH